jgi:hypothetical protein
VSIQGESNLTKSSSFSGRGSCCCPNPFPDTKLHRQLIYSYFIESTGIVEVFRALFASYFTTDDILKLNRKEDLVLIERLKEVVAFVYPRPVSSITPDLEELRYNAYWRMYGYTIRGKENRFVKVSSYNKDFNKLFEGIMYEIFQGILDKGITIEKLSNPNALAEMLDNLQKLLRNRTYNEIEDIASHWAVAFESLLVLLDDDNLMRDRLNIRSVSRYQRLIELGEKLKVPVAKETLYLLALAKRMEAFLLQVDETETWGSTEATALFNQEDSFKEISSAWYQITGRDFLADALSRRRPVSPTAKLPPTPYSM